jgi:hypothetical protein
LHKKITIAALSPFRLNSIGAVDHEFEGPLARVEQV